MERQAGLGRSLEDVLESLTPVDADPAAPGRVLFEPEDVQQQLDQLMADIAALRERVQHLVSLVPEVTVPAVLPAPPAPGHGEKQGTHERGGKRKTKKKKARKKDK